MTRRKTHEEFVRDLNKAHGEGIYIPLEEYKGAKTKILVKHNCKECNLHKWSITPHDLLSGRGCPICGSKKSIKKRTRTHQNFIQEINDEYFNEYRILGKYVNANTKIKVKHNKCGYKYETMPASILNGIGCPICSNKKSVLGINTIWDTDRWMVDLGVSEEDAKKYTRCSGQKIVVTCPDCGREKKISIYHIYNNKTIFCACGNGKSYPEKFVFNLLEQLNSDFEAEYSPKWIDNKRYDFYIKNSSCIIETHGLQHYDSGFDRIGGRDLTKEQQNDKYKRETALSNGIKHYITLDCRESSLDYIKNSILNSELSQLFDLSKIDWNKCAEFANKNIVKEVCNYWNNKKYETTSDIGKIFKLNRTTIITYLKRGTKLGWCNYDPKEEMKKIGKQNSKSRSRKIKVIKNNKNLGIFESCAELSRQSEKLFGVKFLIGSMSRVCLGKRKSHKGFTFEYVEENNN